MKKKFSRHAVDFALEGTKHWQEFGITCSVDLENENVLITKDETDVLCFIARTLEGRKFARGYFFIEDGTCGFSKSELSEKEIEFITKHATVNQ